MAAQRTSRRAEDVRDAIPKTRRVNEKVREIAERVRTPITILYRTYNITLAILSILRYTKTVERRERQPGRGIGALPPDMDIGAMTPTTITVRLSTAQVS